jgi:hypothetical protein
MQSNPYQSPGPSLPGSYVPAQPPVRPTSVTVFGILNLLFGVLGFCGTLGSGAMMFLMPQNPNVRNPVLELMANSPGYRLFNQVSIGLGLVATIVLIAAGIGLLKMKPFGRLLSIGYSMYAIAGGVVGLAMSYVFLIQPLMEQAGAVGGGPEQAAAIGGAIGGLFGGCLGMAYPIILLIFMYRRNVVEALRS